MDGFINWQMLTVWGTYLAIVYMLVEFTKEIPGIKNIKTKYWCAGVAFLLLTLVNLHEGTFHLWDTLLYALTAVLVSFTGKGLKDWSKSDNNIPPSQ